MILPELPQADTLDEKQELRRLLLAALDRLEKEISEEIRAGPPPLEFLADSVIRCGEIVKPFPARHYAILEFVWKSKDRKATKESVKEKALFDDSLDNKYIVEEVGKARRFMRINNFGWIVCNELRHIAIRNYG